MSEELADILNQAQVIHLQPDDMIVLRIATDMDITPDLAERVREAFTPRRVVILAAGIGIGHTDGAVHWEVGA